MMVNERIAATQCHIACLQETRGGILLLWNDASVSMNDMEIGRYSISANVTISQCASTYRLATVYSPSRRVEKNLFLNHLREIKPADDTKWVILGDFIVIYRARDKNNRNLNLRLMQSFRRTLDYCQLKEINLQNRKYTWSNERRNPTLVRLDRAFCNQEWDIHYENYILNVLSSSHSDHYPILLANQDTMRRPTPFKFENF